MYRVRAFIPGSQYNVELTSIFLPSQVLLDQSAEIFFYYIYGERQQSSDAF